MREYKSRVRFPHTYLNTTLLSFRTDRGFSTSMKNTTLFIALWVPLIVGYIQCSDTYLFPKWRIFLSGVFWSTPLSFGLILSTLKVGRKFKTFTSTIMLISTLVRSTTLLQLKMWIIIPMILFESYAIYSLFAERNPQ